MVNNPVLDEALKRFSSIETTAEFFKERLLSTVSSMLDKGFSYTINIPEDAESGSLNERVNTRLQGWTDIPSEDETSKKSREVILMKITLPTLIYGKIVNVTYNIRNKDDVRALVNLFDKDKKNFKSSQ